MKHFQNRRIGLALGSGAARGWAHIGVIKALSELGIHAELIAGTSIGALVGASLAADRIHELEETAFCLDWKQILTFLDITFPRSGLIDGRRVADFFRNHIDDIDFEDLNVPFSAVSTDLGTGREIILQNGSLVDAVRASISVPGILTPVRMNGSVLVDGGLVNSVPVSVAREMGADFVIAVDLNHDLVENKFTISADQKIRASSEICNTLSGNRIIQALNERLKAIKAFGQFSKWTRKDPLPNIFDVIMASINTMEAQITSIRLETDPADILIQPDLGHIRFLEFNKAEETIFEGYHKTMSVFREIESE